MGRTSQDLRDLITALRTDLKEGLDPPAGRRLRHALALLEAASDALADVAALEEGDGETPARC